MECAVTGNAPMLPDPKAVFRLALAPAMLLLPGFRLPETTVDPFTIFS